MKKWIITGVSGSGRIELLLNLKELSEKIGKKIMVHDVGELIQKEALKSKINLTDNRVLDIDRNLLQTLRENALKEIELLVLKNPDTDLHLIGIHATFRWKHRLIEGLSYRNLERFKIEGFINVVDDVKQIFKINSKNKKWDKETLPNLEETQNWMIEEEFATRVLADFYNKPMYVVARNHNLNNLKDFFFGSKKKVYLSYPITAIKESNPELLKKIQTRILEDVEKYFVVFNPLAIKDMALTYGEQNLDFKGGFAEITEKTKELIKARTVERDFTFIDQSDAVVVIYPTDKISPGVLAEIIYAHRNQKPVFMHFTSKKSPFLENYVTYLTDELEDLMINLKGFSNDN